MRENRTSGTEWGVSGNRHSYHDYEKMEYMFKIQELEKYFETADFIDVKVFEGDTTLRRFIASILSYYPWWVIML